MLSVIGRPPGLPVTPAATPNDSPLVKLPPAVLLPSVEGFPAAPRFTRAMRPPKTMTGYVPDLTFTGLTPRARGQADIDKFTRELEQMHEAYPNVLDMARALAKDFIKEHTSEDLDPDETYFLRFHEAFSSSRAHSGWQHGQKPDEAITLTHLFMQRFRSRDETSSISLDQIGGIYRVRDAELYDDTNEVPVLPSVLLKALWKIDLSGTYEKKVNEFWSTYSDQFRANVKGSMLMDLLTAQDSGNLTSTDFANFSTLLTDYKRPLAPLTARQLLNTEITPPENMHVYPFNILGHQATDLLLVVVPSGEQILYAPGAVPAMASIRSSQELYEWLKNTLDEPAARKALLAHFPAKALGDGLKDAVEKIIRGDFPLVHTLDGTGAYEIVKYTPSTRIRNDIPGALRDRIQARMESDAGFYLRSNSEVNRQQWIDSLSDFAHIGGGLAPLAPLIALPVIGAQLAGIGLNVDKAVLGDTAAERHAGAVDAAAGAVNVLFNLPMLASPQTRASAVARTAIAVTSIEARQGVSSIGKPAIETFELAPPEDETAPETNEISAFDAAFHSVLIPPPPKVIPVELIPFELPFTMTGRFGVEDPSRVLFNQNDGKHYLQVLGKTFQVRYDSTIGGWAIIDPANPHAFFGSRPVRLGADNEWQLTPSAALRGGAPLATKTLPTSVLDGVSVTAPRAGEFVQRYEVIVNGEILAVKYHPPSTTWRTSDGTAYRHETTRGSFVNVLSPDAGPVTSNADMNKALKSLGLQVEYPLQLPPLDTRTFEDIPRKISSLWLGGRLPLGLVKNLESNALLASKGERPFKTTLYLSIKNPEERAVTLAELATQAPHVQIQELEEVAFFKTFKASPSYTQYVAATTSRGGNLSSASDLLRYPMMDAEGGLYLDIDDTLKSKLPEDRRFGDLEFKAAPNELILNEPVNHELLGMRSDFNSSNFGTLPNNSLLRAVSMRITERYRQNSAFYDSRPYQGSDTAQTMNAYAHTLNEMTGPGVLNSVIGERMPSYRQFSGLLRIAHGELYLEQEELDRITALVIERQSSYAALGDVIDVNSTASWLDNR